MSDYIITNDGLVNADELMHWKYIKKVFDGKGGYKYIYDVSELEKSKNNMDKAQKKASASQQKYINYEVPQKGLGRLKAIKKDILRENAETNTKAYKKAKRKYKSEKIQATVAKGMYDTSKKVKNI